MMARVQFLAASADPRSGKEGTVYGPGHITDFDDDDVDFVIAELGKGKVSILDTSGLTPPVLERIYGTVGQEQK